MKSTAYVASEDSATLRDAMRSYSGGACLEIGAGNGGNLEELSKRFELVVGTDLVKPALDDWRECGANYIIADSASCFRRGSFELVAFNPPYLPSKEISDRAVDGGRSGAEIAMRFLRDSLAVIKRGGRILLLLSDVNPEEEFRRECSGRGFTMKKVSEKRLFCETLSVYEVFHAKRRSSGDAGGSTSGHGGRMASRLGRTAGAHASVRGRFRSAPGSRVSFSRRS